MANFSKKFVWYLVIIGMVMLADALMSYSAPVVMGKTVGSASIMGLIFASSSLVGMLVDFIFAKTFVGKKHQFFLKLLLATACFFPLSLLFFKFIPSYLFGMAVWGVYFEAMVFSNYHAIHEFVPLVHHAKAWGILSLLRNLSLVVGPFIASRYGGESLRYALILAFILYLVAIVLFIFYKGSWSWNKTTIDVVARAEDSRKFFQEIKLWKTFLKKLWPLLLFLWIFYLIDSAFYVIGPLFTEALKVNNELGDLFVSIYSLPGLFLGFIIEFLARPLGKKRIAFLAGILAGVFLVIMSFQKEVIFILVATFIASVGLGVILPEILAVFENYITRVGKVGNDLIGLAAIFSSFAYVVGPIVNGFIFELQGAQMAFRVWGIILSIFSILLLIFVPRKIKMPQQELEEVAHQIT